MTFAERLRLAWHSHPVPKSRLASACKVSKGAVTQWFSGDTQPKSEAAMLLAQELGVALDWLVLGRGRMEGDGLMAREGDGPPYHTPRQAVSWLPLLEWSALPLDRPPQPDGMTPLIPCLATCGPRGFALRVQGDSMAPVYRDGEVLLLDPDAVASHNRDIVLLLNARPAFRRLQHSPEGRMLVALNPDHPSRIQPLPDDAAICGVVVASYMER